MLRKIKVSSFISEGGIHIEIPPRNPQHIIFILLPLVLGVIIDTRLIKKWLIEITLCRVLLENIIPTFRRLGQLVVHCRD